MSDHEFIFGLSDLEYKLLIKVLYAYKNELERIGFKHELGLTYDACNTVQSTIDKINNGIQ